MRVLRDQIYGSQYAQQNALNGQMSGPENCVLKKKWPVSGFLHTGPKIGVEKEYTIIFHDFFDTKIRHTF